ncbi:PadR family transcriptional regulator [Clostridium tagluense]|uniref:PadR family transcriptional regulator n=1 Tax=Clostridium tagluense TaxID=360422 RepID=UPI001CF291C6|nr:PadR family transcriptional regulator [Clostridium tagluense]MCB2312482.1 PadR family transcriptional regulator [Clostridium tagluense]MCB2317157.1 PadR family transcriptional regulator [Clostridium tagluense]MCB2322021.1 PadR family transcriptional regulator [Clostridium tagluense]MCB2327030.1 PadR family transcriptional regulator [Clostridium tagluense]MCB2331748.1 PadR family transcriptional regulator [Clostridium tagluense]
MNKLSYGLLSLLSTEPMTGYDLTSKINRFWRSTHSAIYPLLSELEENKYIEFILKKQDGKPDKKIYNLTVQGKEFLHKWFTSETSDAVVRDEMTLKLYCIQYMDTESVEKLLNELETRYKKKIKEYKSSIEKIRLKFCENPKAVPPFGAYILTQRVLNEAILDLKWCDWVRNVYNNNYLNFSEQNFEDEGR